MGLLRQNEQQHYIGRKEFTGDGTTTIFTVTSVLDAFNSNLSIAPGFTNDRIELFIDGIQHPQHYVDPTLAAVINYSFEYDAINGWAVTFVTAPSNGARIFLDIKIGLLDNDATSGPHVGTTDVVAKYHVTPLKDVINNFMIAYTGEDKIISKVNRTDDSSGIDRVLYPQQKTSNPKAIKQETGGDYSFDMNDDGVEDSTMLIHPEASDTWTSFKSTSSTTTPEDFDNNTYWDYLGQRYGLDGGMAQSNGNFYIDETAGLIHFSSNISGLTITLRYISDSLGTDEEMVVHKFAEEAIYKSLMYAILSTRSNVQEYVVQRYKRERFAAIRTAKLRLSNIKLEELTQILRGKSKIIKH